MGEEHLKPEIFWFYPEYNKDKDNRANQISYEECCGCCSKVIGYCIQRHDHQKITSDHMKDPKNNVWCDFICAKCAKECYNINEPELSI